MNTIARFLMVSACTSLALGCDRDDAPDKAGSIDNRSPQAEPANNARDAMEYTSAEVELVDGALDRRTIRIEDPAEIRRLLSQFPGVGTGKKGTEPPAPWITAMIVRFTRADSTVLKVQCSSFPTGEAELKSNYLTFWSEGHGQNEWLIDNPMEFGRYFAKLFKEDSKSEKQNEP